MIVYILVKKKKFFFSTFMVYDDFEIYDIVKFVYFVLK